MYQADLPSIQTFLFNLLVKNAAPEATDWLTPKLEQVRSAASDKDFYLAFSAAPRFVGKKPLALTQTDLQEAERIRKGFCPAAWTADQAARTLLLLSLPHDDAEKFVKSINRLYDTADMAELVALYACLPLLPYPEQFRERAAEGVRTNIGSVFEAVALDNPYPAGYLSEGAWNQLVLKTVFVGKPLYRIYGLDERSNPALARMLSDYAHERWAADRPVTPELWRPVGPFLDEAILEDIRKLFAHPLPVQHEAAALACYHSNLPAAKQLLEAHPHLKTSIETGQLTWQDIGRKSLALL